MVLSKAQKILLGIFTLLPFVLTPIILWQMAHGIFHIIQLNEHREPEPSEIFAVVISFIAPIILLVLTSLVLLTFYIVHAVMNKKLSTAEQLVWILIFFFFGIVAFPVYWFIAIWNNANKA
jgi:hypothetical protein